MIWDLLKYIYLIYKYCRILEKERIMRKAQKKQAEDLVKLLGQAHLEIKKNMETGQKEASLALLAQCQEGAIELGKMIEGEEGEKAAPIPHLESYCETVYEAFEALRHGQSKSSGRIYKNLRKSLIKVENSVKYDIKVRLEIVFLPYKASMWDSLESVWMAADEDPDCDAYVVPIPYYDRNQDGNFVKRHYEGENFPDYVPITRYDAYCLAERRPDVIYIHNPYDNWNYVTSIDPAFYSWELKKYTDCLVYIPYYSTTGGMSKGQSLCHSYFNVDYIAVQCQSIIEQFDESIPREKFLPLGSPKFDRVIRLCKNPPEAPKEWEQKRQGRKVYFYNTSIGGMLKDTEAFLDKMEYVFRCFEERKQVCILWRPHPLLESTFKSMREQYYSRFWQLKTYFMDSGLGIYDDTPDITKTVAYCDGYIGDSGTSVTSLFGVAGKPMFILNNRIHSDPDEDSWRGEINIGERRQGRFVIAQGNRLYVSRPFAHDYSYLCDLSDYAYEGDYNVVWELDKKLYVCPQNAQDILVIHEDGHKSKVGLQPFLLQSGAFHWSVLYEKWLLLRPTRYPAIVRYHTSTGELKYFTEHLDVFIKETDGALKIGGSALQDGKYYNFSPTDRQVYVLDVATGESTVREVPTKNQCGYGSVVAYQGNFWLMPYGGERLSVTCWNPKTNEVREYDRFPEGFACIEPNSKCERAELPFINGAFYGEHLYLTPNFGNMYVKLNINTGEMKEWIPPFEDVEGKEYFYTQSKSVFLHGIPNERGMAPIFFYPTRTMYEINPTTGECVELKAHFDVRELKDHEPGFCRHSRSLRYCCRENAFNSMKDFLDNDITGNPFSREQQMEAYREIAANNDGTCGLKIHEYICQRQWRTGW